MMKLTLSLKQRLQLCFLAAKTPECSRRLFKLTSRLIDQYTKE